MLPVLSFAEAKTTFKDVEVTAEALPAPHRYIITSPTVGDWRSVKITPSSENEILSRLSPGRRLRYLAKNNQSEFLILLVGFVGGSYMILASLLNIFPSLGNLWSSVAIAAPASGVGGTMMGSARDSFDWYIGLLMGVTLISTLGMTMFATTESKITFGKDTSKMIIGFVVGFLSGGRSK